MRFGGLCVATCLCLVWTAAAGAQVQEPAAPERLAPEKLQAAIDALGNLDYDTRMAASRTVRRTPLAQAVPALLAAVSEHADGYVRYRALVLLTGFNDPRTLDVMRESLSSPNDRLRAVAYSFFEHHPAKTMTPTLLAALDKELGEFVRPSLVRALAAAGDDPAVHPVLAREAGRGQDFFRSTVIEALGDYRAGYAVDAVAAIAELDGPLQDDAALALGKIGDPKALAVLAGLQRSADRALQPTVATAICLLGTNCEAHERYLIDTLAFADQNAGFQDLMRAAAAGLGELAIRGRASALAALFASGSSRAESTRAPVALALAKIALRNTDLVLRDLAPRPNRNDAIALLADGFDMLEEDLDKERFFAAIRRTYWDAADGSATRELMQTLIGRLDF